MKIIPELVGHNFSRYPEDYNKSADTQMEVAGKLSSLIGINTDREKVSSVLEVGCGTGFLTAKIMDQFPDSQFLITDISSSMLRYCQKKLTQSKVAENINFRTHDISCGSPDGKFDLITSSLAFQWIEDIDKLFKDLHAHLAEKGQLIFTTLTQRTFANIAELFENHNICFPIPILPKLSDIKNAASCFGEIEIIEETYIEKYKSIKEFLDHIHKVGAGNATGERTPVSQLREIIKAEKKEIIAEYHVALCRFKKGPEIPDLC